MSDQASKPIIYFVQLGASGVTEQPTYPSDIAVVELSAFEAQAQQLASLRAENENLNRRIKTWHEPDQKLLEKERDELKSKLEASQNHLSTLQGEMEVEQQKYQTLKAKLEAAEKETREQNELLKIMADVDLNSGLEIENLKAEVERWKSEASTHARVADQCAAEKLTLQDEVERLNARCRSDYDEAIVKENRLFLKIHNLQELVNRYRAALESVAMNYERQHLNATSADNCGDKVFKALADAPEIDSKQAPPLAGQCFRICSAEGVDCVCRPETGPSKDEKCPSCGSTEFRKLHPHSAIRSCLKCNTGWTNAKVTLD